jgi:hypothetical protein
MFKSIKYILFTSIIISSLLLTACGAESTTESAQNSNIQTAVAQTIAVQNAGQITSVSAPVIPDYTQTPLQFSPTGTPSAPTILPTRTFNPTTSECAQASLISETIPDGTIFKPGQTFTKTWEIKNTSNCSWDKSYKIVFWDGDVLGGAYVYNLPQAVDPGQTVPISLLLTAPKTDATYTSKWMFQTPDSIEFGVGQYNAPFYAEIVVSSDGKPNYAITSVEYSVVRDPATGCPANVNHIVYATFTSNGPVEFSYSWLQSDGNDSKPKTLKMEAAGTLTISREWKIHLGSTPGTKWISIVIVEPVYQEYPRAEFTYLCGS